MHHTHSISIIFQAGIIKHILTVQLSKTQRHLRMAMRKVITSINLATSYHKIEKDECIWKKQSQSSGTNEPCTFHETNMKSVNVIIRSCKIDFITPFSFSFSNKAWNQVRNLFLKNQSTRSLTKEGWQKTQPWSLFTGIFTHITKVQ